jgi:hypothetical protein
VSLAKPQTVRPGAREAHDRLTRALLDLTHRGMRPRCGDPEAHDWWLSESQQEREVAARWCRSCPILTPCGDVGQSQRFGVFGGVDRTPRPYSKINSAQDQ